MGLAGNLATTWLLAAGTLAGQARPSSGVSKGARVADPKITLASMSSVWLGFSAAARDGAVSLTWLAWTVVGIFLLEAAQNASGEIFDWDSGTDRGVASRRLSCCLRSSRPPGCRRSRPLVSSACPPPLSPPTGA